MFVKGQLASNVNIHTYITMDMMDVKRGGIILKLQGEVNSLVRISFCRPYLKAIDM